MRFFSYLTKQWVKNGIAAILNNTFKKIKTEVAYSA